MRGRKLVVNVPVNARGGRKPLTVNVGDIIIDRAVLDGRSPLTPDRVKCCGVWLCPTSLEHHRTSLKHLRGRSARGMS